MNIEILLIFGIGILALILAIIHRYDNFRSFLIVSCFSFCAGTTLLILNHEVQNSRDNLQTINIESNSGHETVNEVAE